MHPHLRNTIALIATVAACGCASAAATSAKLTVKPLYDGDCPATVVLHGSITSNARGRVRYIFTRSDGAIDTQIKTLSFSAPGTLPVSTTWTLGGGALPRYSGWQAIRVLQKSPIESAHANFQVRCDPPLNSARAAHGNTDWHIDTANEFLFGRDMAGASTAANFAPGSWTKGHIHVGLTNTAGFYDDQSHVAAGDDDNLTNGIDKPMLFFYAGHGNPTFWDTLGNGGTQSDLLLGNLAGGGQLRYFWQCSCEVFAHGPSVCTGTDCDYSRPANFDGSADSAAMRNVFQRWGPAIGDDLRMACGVSTLAYCHEGNVNAIWNKFNNESSSVAEAFILGLGSDSVKPLCITRGGSDISKTPLYDSSFTNRRNTAGSGYLHILYQGGTQTEPPVLRWIPEKIPLKLWRVRLVPPGDPPEFARRIVVVDSVEQIRDPLLAGGAAVIKRHPQAGAVTLDAIGKAAADTARAQQPREPREVALDFVRRLGWPRDELGSVQVTQLLTASMPDKGAANALTQGRQNVVVNIGRRIRNGDQTLDVLGAGGRAIVKLAPAGEVLSLTRTWRQAELTREQVSIKPFEQARAEAMKRLVNADAYKLADWRFGYKEAAPNVAQAELPVVYEFDFAPRDRARLLEFPPQQFEIPAAQQ